MYISRRVCFYMVTVIGLIGLDSKDNYLEGEPS
jgi:hypothetical protein